MENKIRINLDENLELVAQLYDYDGQHPEITVYIKKDGYVHQDICLIRPHEGKNLVQEKDAVDCLVWSNPNNEDFTSEYFIPIWEEE
jgi:hypothetical protein